MTEQENTIELMDDIEVVGPGKMLRDARQQMGLSQEQVADNLNFRISLVKDIEDDIFDKSLAETFNRGYLRNYAKLVGVDEEDIIASYENLDIAALQCAEMQSFSKGRVKQVENTLLKWVTVLIGALFIGASVIWWLQDAEQKNTLANDQTTPASEQVVATEAAGTAEQSAQPQQEKTEPEKTAPEKAQATPLAQTFAGNNSSASAVNVPATEQVPPAKPVASPAVTQQIPQQVPQQETSQPTSVSTQQVVAQFTFSGDCWVNISDATGERIAWGVKKSGYVMKISGVPPFNVTLGKPELVTINYDGQAIDTSKFSRGNIAKFELPFAE